MLRLFSLCHLNDGVYWVLLSPYGVVVATSSRGFATEQDARNNLRALRFL